MLFKNILVPYDGSQLSEEALRLALEIAKMTGNSKVSLLNVVEKIPEKIIEFANHHKVDLVVIGSAGLRGISKFFKGLGSVSRNVSERVSCPILIVREKWDTKHDISN